jgi:hypothetical protein
MPRTMFASTMVAVAFLLVAGSGEARAQAARHGTLGNWGGSSFNVGRSTFYANGLVSNRVGDTTYFNNGLVGRQVGAVTVYNNGLVAVDRGRMTVYSNYAVGVPIRGGMVYAGGSPYPFGPTAFPPPPPSR